MKTSLHLWETHWRQLGCALYTGIFLRTWHLVTPVKYLLPCPEDLVQEIKKEGWKIDKAGSFFWCYGLKVCVPKFTHWNTNAQRDGVRRWGLWAGWSPHEWDLCSYKRDPAELPSPCYQLRIQEVCDPEEGPHPIMLACWSRTSSLQSCEN